jgi:hypothetical protein
MFKLPVRIWILNAAAAISGRHGAVTEQARRSECSRETVYGHARKVEQRLAPDPDPEAALARLRRENHRLQQVLAQRERDAEGLVRCDKAKQRQLATTAFAMGLSLRQIEELLAHLLPPAKAPDHSTVGHWIKAEAQRAGRVLAALDAACVPRVQTLCLDEIFFGGGRPWWGSSRRA